MQKYGRNSLSYSTYKKTAEPHISTEKINGEDTTDDIQLNTKDEDPIILRYGNIKIDPCYLISKSPLSCIVNGQEDFLADMTCFTPRDILSYNTEDWKLILSGSYGEELDQDRVLASVYSGLPKKLRGKIWLYISRVKELKHESSLKGITFQDLVRRPCADEHLVDRDVVRSFGNFNFFQDNKKEKLLGLRRILCAYANFDPEIGYTQGLNFLAGMLYYLIHTDQVESDCFLGIRECEEDVFWVLVYIMHYKSWRSLFMDDTPKLLKLLQELEAKMQKRLPQLYEHLCENNCIAACFSQYFLTLYLFNTPFSFARRFLEIFLVAGHEALIHVSLELLSKAESDIEERDSICELLPFLKTELVTFTLTKYKKYFSKFLAEPPL